MVLKAIHSFKWFYVSRGVGALLAIYGLLLDHTPERGTIIVTGAGLLGFDRVAHRDKE